MNSWQMRFLIYSIIGTLIRLQKNKSVNKKNVSLPVFYGVLEVKHVLPERIRLYVPSIKGDLERVEFLLNNFNKIDGVNEVEINHILGTVLVKFDENKLQPILIIGIIIKLLGLENEVEKEPKSLVNRETQNVRQAVNLAVYNKTKGLVDLKDLMLISFIVLGIYKMKNKQGYNVGGSTLLWWAYTLLTTPSRE